MEADQIIKIDYSCPVFQIGRTTITEAGQQHDIFLMRDDEYVLALVYNSDTKLYYVVEQFRYGLNHPLNEFIGGGKKRDERAHDAIMRELREELGFEIGKNYELDDIRLLYISFMSPYISNAKAYLFYIEVHGRHSEQDLDRFEQLKIRQCTADQIQELITKGITSSHTALIWSLYNNKFKGSAYAK